MRRAVVAVVSAAVMSAVAGCGGGAQEDVSSEPSGELADTPTSPAPTPTTDAGGVEVEGTMELAPPVVADSDQVPGTWSQVYGRTAPELQCVDNPDRDAVVVGTIAFENLTPKYTPVDVRVALWNYSANNTGVELEVHYGDDVRCDSFSFAPAMDDASWGPVPIAFVAPLAYGPSGFDDGAYAAAQEYLGIRDVEPGQNLADDTGSNLMSFRLPSPASVPGEAAGATSCASIWVRGQTLPADYSGCSLPDGSAAAETTTLCTDGTTLVQLDGYGYAYLGDRIAGAGQDPALEGAVLVACES